MCAARGVGAGCGDVGQASGPVVSAAWGRVGGVLSSLSFFCFLVVLVVELGWWGVSCFWVVTGC